MFLRKGCKSMANRGSKSTIKKIVLGIVIVFLALLILLGVTGVFYYNSSLQPKNPESEEVTEVEISPGSSRADIARILEEEGTIESAFVFNTYSRLNEEQGFQAGYYNMSRSMSVDEIVDYLQEGGSAVSKDEYPTVTLPEGIPLAEMATIIDEDTEFSEDEFMEVVQDENFLNEKLEQFPELLTDVFEEEETRYKLEGYLYPATYEIREETTVEDLVTEMISQMNQVVEPYYDDIEESEYNVNETLTLASFIEREGITDEDRKVISGVFHNRLEVGMPLQTDVSVTYALGEHQERISYNDLEVDSPYNSYMYAGLGPGPVNNPSKPSIDAAVNPTDTDYLYFLSDLDTREVYFSETYDQHLEYQEEYLR